MLVLQHLQARLKRSLKMAPLVSCVHPETQGSLGVVVCALTYPWACYYRLSSVARFFVSCAYISLSSTTGAINHNHIIVSQ